jgi:hypothetical protein
MDSKSPGVARGGSWLIEPVGSRPVFVLGDFGREEHQYAEVAEEFVKNEVTPRLAEIEAQEEGLMPAILKKAGERSEGAVRAGSRLRRSATRAC